MKKTLITISIILIITSTFAQQISSNYRTMNGKLIIKSILNNESVKLTSNKTIIRLNYENGNFKLVQKLSDFTISNTKLINNNMISGEDIVIEGKLNLDYINTKEHAPINFSFEAFLKPGESFIHGEGKLVHLIEKSNSACIISMSFTTAAENLSNINFENGKKVKFEIIQSLMARDND